MPMVDDDPLVKPGGSDDQEGDAKGRTVFGIGLPAGAKPAGAGKTGPAPMARPPVAPMPAPAPARPRAPEPAPTPTPVAAESARVDHTLHALPSALLGAVAQATGRPMPDATQHDVREIRGGDATQHDMRVQSRMAEDSATLRRPVTGDYAATTPDIGHGKTGAHPALPQQTTPGVEKPRLRLVAGKAIPGTRYRLLRWLGEGGMGVVYEAEHIDIERRVALKVLRSELSERSDTAQVFREEARAAARAGSKNNVEIFDFGELPDGRLFFCMELLSGTDLAAMLEQDIEPARTFAILRQICKGLGAAHKAGIVHRDIKPENIILIEHEGKRDMVKIVDFGVAAILDARRDGGGPIAGTPQYMAPEQISGGEFDARLDIYAMGCMAYEIMVRHPPFPMENLADVLLAHLNTAPPRPLTVRPDAQPKSLEEVVMRCLEKDPANRYANMAELEAAICEAQIAAGIVTEWDDLPLPDIDPDRRASLVARMPSSNLAAPQKRRWLLPVVAAVSAAALTGIVLMAIGSPEVPPEVTAQIEALSKEAREAASVGHYVSPEEGTPAISPILKLESIAGPGEAPADERGQVLRREFSNQLVTVADKFWDQEPTRGLAFEYYDWALVFDPDNSHALERAPRTAGERKAMLERALAGKLSEGEKSAMAVASAMIDPDEQARKERLGALMADNRMPLSRKMVLEEAVRGTGVEVPSGPKKVDPPPEVKPPPVEPPPVEPPTVEDPPVEPVDDGGKKPRPGGTKKPKSDELAEGELENSAIKRDPVKASELAGQGTAALNAGRRADAENLFNQAIGYDRKCAEALIGLSDISFDRGSAQKAQRFAEQAVSIAPNNGSYRIKLGDAYYNALRYRDALTQYEKAQALGDGKAAQRIVKVKAKLGG
jgi:serine/threonine protein kinase/tetratricopeptide (TPR) repeat protein